MAFIGIEKRIQKTGFSMKELHSHVHYEIYYLTKGERKIFLSNVLYDISAPCLIIVPPHIPHRSDGGPFERYVINVMPDYLNKYQKDTLDRMALQIITPNEDENKTFISILEDFKNTNPFELHGASIINALFSYFVFMAGKQNSFSHNALTLEKKYISPLIFDIIECFNSNYQKKITLDDISKEFYISKTTLIYNFKKYVNCSPMDYLLKIRLLNAKKMLLETTKSINEISYLTGFSSPNYFSLIFKKKENISPARYRRYYTEEAKPSEFNMI